MNERVVWVDDDTELKPFQEALRDAGLKLSFTPSIDEAVKRTRRTKDDDLALLIWDASILPHGRDFAPCVEEDDVLGGISFFNWFRSAHPRIPTLLFTNFSTMVPERSRPDRKEFAASKGEYLLPQDFASFVRGLLF
ncbi:hypothetical protein KBB27_01410 [Patescibacteria group bacterium]|nr:hypothetical protein [Patescibacteria group bacterium]